MQLQKFRIMLHWNFLHRSGGNFASTFTISAGFILVEVKNISNISNVPFTILGIAWILRQPIDYCGESVNMGTVYLSFFFFFAKMQMKSWNECIFVFK